LKEAFAFIVDAVRHAGHAAQIVALTELLHRFS
jgi:hypothetical protein